MRLACSLIFAAFSLSGCASHRAAVRDAKFDDYFERYCDYTGNMGIGFVASHTYDFEFRQRLKTTQDRELRRLLVLQNLYLETDRAIRDFESGIVMTGQSSSRQMTAEERASTRLSLMTQVDDLSRFDPGDPQREIAEFRERLGQVKPGVSE